MSSLDTLVAGEQALAALGPTPFHLPLGPLAPAVAGAFTAMPKGEWVVAGPRTRVGVVLRGCPPRRLTDPAQGARPYKLAPVSQAPGSRALHAVGLALGSGKPVLCMLGLASAASGALHEALNASVLTGAPVIFVVVRQALTDDAPVGRQLAGNLVALAQAHGAQAVSVDATEAAVHGAVASARAHTGPTLIEACLS